MRYAAAEKLEIIRLVEQSSLSVRRPGAARNPALHLLLLVRSLSSRPLARCGMWDRSIFS
jgi:hypothetical protein